MREKDIAFEFGKFWVGKQDGLWTVFENHITHAKSIGTAWSGDVDGLSLAISYAVHKGGGKPEPQVSLELAQAYYGSEK